METKSGPSTAVTKRAYTAPSLLERDFSPHEIPTTTDRVQFAPLPKMVSAMQHASSIPEQDMEIRHRELLFHELRVRKSTRHRACELQGEEVLRPAQTPVTMGQTHRMSLSIRPRRLISWNPRSTRKESEFVLILEEQAIFYLEARLLPY